MSADFDNLPNSKETTSTHQRTKAKLVDNECQALSKEFSFVPRQVSHSLRDNYLLFQGNGWRHHLLFRKLKQKSLTIGFRHSWTLDEAHKGNAYSLRDNYLLLHGNSGRRLRFREQKQKSLTIGFRHSHGTTDFDDVQNSIVMFFFLFHLLKW